jgi:hydroxysqualene dehydroxylase
MENIARIGIIGGGLAGLSAALALATAGAEVELFEAGELLGGRAATAGQIASDKEVEDFRYVSFGCDTNFLALCRQIGAERYL